VVALPPTQNKERKVTPQQEEQHERFRQPIAYGKGAKDRPEYAELAKSRGVSGFNVAVADFLHAPEILDIEASAYTGAPGQAIHITAVDDVAVATVGVLIMADDGTLIEKGSAVPQPPDPRRWVYTTTASSAAVAVKIVVDAADLAGQITEETKHT